jgi:hypothetical protein
MAEDAVSWRMLENSLVGGVTPWTPGWAVLPYSSPE